MALTDNLLAYYKLDETSGTTSTDEVNSYNGTISGVTINQTGKLNSAYSFTANSNFVTFGSQLDTIGTSSFSISFWIKSNSATGGRIATKDNDYSTNGSWGVYYDPTGIGIFYRGASTITLSSVTTVNDNIWHHVVITRNPTNGTRKIYIDGSLDSQISSGDTFTGSGLSPTTIGSEHSTSNEYPNGFIGLLDEVGFWTREISSSEVSTLYNSGAGLEYPLSTPSGSNDDFYTMSLGAEF